MVWYSHLFKSFPQSVVIHTVKGFGIVNKQKYMFFWNSLVLFDDPVDAGNLISSSSACFLIQLEYYILLKPRLENMSITLLACEMSTVVW